MLILMNVQIIEGQQIECRTIISNSDTGIICNTTDPEKGMNKMVLNNGTYSIVEKSSTKGADIYSVAFTDSENGWAIGMMVDCSVNCGVIFRTNDGGQNWVLQYRSGTDLRLETFGFNNSENGWAYGTRTVGDKTFDTTLVTNDGGKTWLEGAGIQAELDTKTIALNTVN